MINRTLSQVINNAENNERLQNFQLSEKSIIVIPNLNMITTEALKLIEKSDTVHDDNIHITDSASWADISPELRQELKTSGIRYPLYEEHTQDTELPPDFSLLSSPPQLINDIFTDATSIKVRKKSIFVFIVNSCIVKHYVIFHDKQCRGREHDQLALRNTFHTYYIFLWCYR